MGTNRRKTKKRSYYNYFRKISKRQKYSLCGINDKKFDAFKSIDELIKLKNSMPDTKNGVSVKLVKNANSIEISAKLEKNGRLASDPSIGMTTIISACLRKLG